MNKPILTKTTQEFRGSIILDQPYFYIVHKIIEKSAAYEVMRVELSIEALSNVIEGSDIEPCVYDLVVKTIKRKCEDGDINLS